jgi:uncharacterized protein YcbX
LFRYPVKSLQGEPRTALDAKHDGIGGDRRFGVLDESSGTVISAKREGRLLFASARLDEGVPTVLVPGAGEFEPGVALNDALSEWLGRSVHLVSADRHGPGTFECPIDFESDDSEPVRWEGPDYSFVDSSQVHVLTTSSVHMLEGERPDLDWSLQRFRPNIVIEAPDRGPLEMGWIGRQVRIGSAVLEVDKPCSRCVMTTRPQPGGRERQLDILRHVSTNHESSVGVLAHVVVPGTIRTGDSPEL